MATLSFSRIRRKWRVRYRATNRKTHQVFSGSKVFFEKSQAVKFYADIESQEKAWRDGSTAPGELIADVVTQFFSHCQRHTLRTQGHYKDVLHKFLDGLPKDVIRIQQLSPNHLQDYLYRLKDRQVTNRTCNAHLTPIKTFCRFYSRRFGILNPGDSVMMLKEDPPHSRFLTLDEYHRLLDVANPIAKDRIVFLANTGLRASEFAALNPDSLCPQVTAIIVKGKGRKQRIVPLNQAAKEVLPRLKLTGKNGLWLQFHRLAKRAGIPNFGPHALRHFFATQLLLKGVPLIIVSKLLGHSSTRTTEQSYAHILQADLANATEVLTNI